MNRRELIFGGLASLLVGCSNDKEREDKKGKLKERILEEKIKERQKQAVDKNLYEKAVTVAQTLGKLVKESSNSTYREYLFNDKSFLTIENSYFPSRLGEMHDDDYVYYGPSNVRVLVYGKLVFEKINYEEISAYVPGQRWEEELLKAYNEALRIRGKKQQEKEKREEELANEERKKLLERFGLIEEELK